MNMPTHFVKLLLALAFGLVSTLGLVAKTFYFDVPGKPMTVFEARKSLTESLQHLNYDELHIRDVKFKRDQITFTAVIKGTANNGILPFVGSGKVSVQCNDSATLSDIIFEGKKMKPIGAVWPRFKTLTVAMKFVDAYLTLRKAALATDTEAADFTAFSLAAKTWLETNPKPAMPNEARAYKVLAEDAFKRKDFHAALESYLEALGAFPLWPEGQYNAALLAAEIEDYELAAKHMRRYLALAPGATDTAAAEDKLLLWELKAKE